LTSIRHYRSRRTRLFTLPQRYNNHNNNKLIRLVKKSGSGEKHFVENMVKAPATVQQTITN